MLSIKQSEKTLNKNKEKYTEQEVLKIREFLYKMARIIIESKDTTRHGK